MIGEFYHGIKPCEHCFDLAEWTVFDDEHEFSVNLCTKHKDKFMME